MANKRLKIVIVTAIMPVRDVVFDSHLLRDSESDLQR